MELDHLDAGEPDALESAVRCASLSPKRVNLSPSTIDLLTSSRALPETILRVHSYLPR